MRKGKANQRAMGLQLRAPSHLYESIKAGVNYLLLIILQV